MDARALCLAILSRGEASGYDIRKHFEQGPFRMFYELGFGSIYPALKGLARDRLIEPATHAKRADRPDRKVFRITAAGRLALIDALGRDPAPTRVRSDFMFIMFFAHLLSPAEIDRLCQRESDGYRKRIDDIECRTPDALTAGQRFVRDVGVAIHRAIADIIDEHRPGLVREALGTGQRRTVGTAP